MTAGSPPDENDERDDADDGIDEPDGEADTLEELLAEGDETADSGAGRAASVEATDGDEPPGTVDDGHSPGGTPGAEAGATTEGDEAASADAEPAADDPASEAGPEAAAAAADVPEDVRKYERFKKIEGGTYDRANDFLRERTYVTAREWAIARLCADFRTETGVEMTKIGENLPELVPFMTDTYTPQAVNQARAAFEEKVRKAGATFLYGAMCDFFTAEELDDVMYEATEVAKFLLEVEGVELTVEEELATEDRISEVMRDVREHSAALRHDEVCCPECGNEFDVAGEDAGGDGGGTAAAEAPDHDEDVGDDADAGNGGMGDDATNETEPDDAESSDGEESSDVAEATPEDADD